MMPKPVGKLDKTTLVLLILLVIPVAWFALMLAPLLTEEADLTSLLEGLNTAMAQPLHIRWVDSSPKFLFLFTGL